MRILSLAMILALLSGCKVPSSSRNMTVQERTQARLNHLIVQADRVVVGNVSISGKSAKTILNAISSSGIAPPLDLDPDWELQFYFKTNLLGEVRLWEGYFKFGDWLYYDGSGVLETLYYNTKEAAMPVSRVHHMQALAIAKQSVAEHDVDLRNYHTPPMVEFDSQAGQWRIGWVKSDLSEWYVVLIDDKTTNVLSSKRVIPDAAHAN